MDLKFYKVCRSCMKKGTDFSNKNNFSEMTEKTIEMFTFCTSIKVFKNDGLPLNICHQCLINVEMCYNFINVCKSTDKALKSSLAENKGAIFFLKDVKIVPHKINTHIETNVKNDVYHNKDCLTEEAYNESNNAALLEQPNNVESNSITNKNKLITKLSETQNNKRFKKTENCTQQNQFRKNFSCPVCKVVIKGRESFDKHLESEHSGFKQYVCKHCKKGFSLANRLKEHELVHSDKRPWKCNSCNKCFKHRGVFRKHQQVHILPGKSFTCESCLLTFNARCALKVHSKIHNKQEPNLCHLCGASFAQVCNLRVHMRIHTGEKPYSCRICAFKCSDKSAMSRHERRHANLKTYKCQHCPKGFNNSGSLLLHNRTHTGELPYKCEYCNKAFIDNWKRKKHLVKIHQIAMENIPKLTPGHSKKAAMT